MESTIWHWIRPEGVRDAVVAARRDDFLNLVEFGFGDKGAINMTKQAPSKIQSNVQRTILDGRNYGQRENSKLGKFDLQTLIEKEINIVGLEEWYENRCGILRSRDTSQLLGAILPPNIEAIATMMGANVPTLCIYNEHTNKSTLTKLRQTTQRLPIMFSHEKDSAQIKNSLHTMIMEHQNMRNTGGSVQGTDWISQILSVN
jgi:hypothetical protein